MNKTQMANTAVIRFTPKWKYAKSKICSGAHLFSMHKRRTCFPVTSEYLGR